MAVVVIGTDVVVVVIIIMVGGGVTGGVAGVMMAVVVVIGAAATLAGATIADWARDAVHYGRDATAAVVGVMMAQDVRRVGCRMVRVASPGDRKS